MRAAQHSRSWLAGGLILSSFALLVTEHLFHYPVALLALWGLGLIARSPRRCLDTPGAGPLLAIFLCVWVPMLTALPDAAHASHSAKTALLYLHFLPAAFCVLHAAGEPGVRRFVFLGCVGLVGFACLDALIQLALGRDLFGYPDDGPVLTGVFYPKQRLGLILAVFTPLCLEVVQRLSVRHDGWWLVSAPVVIVILLSLKRTAWIMFAVAAAGFGWWMWRQHGRFAARRVLAPIVALLLIATVTLSLSPALGGRLAATLDLLGTDPALVDQASSHRVSLWRTGAAIVIDHWFNGVGPRGYRHVYADYAAPDDFWMHGDAGGQTHPHLMLLEVVIETGVVGLVAYVILWVVLLRALSRAIPDRASAPWLLAVVVAWFPFNAHLAFYGSYWSTLVWLMLPLGLATHACQPRRARSATAGR